MPHPSHPPWLDHPNYTWRRTTASTNINTKTNTVYNKNYRFRRSSIAKCDTAPNVEIVCMFSNGPIVCSRPRECAGFITVLHHVPRAPWLRGDAAQLSWEGLAWSEGHSTRMKRQSVIASQCHSQMSLPVCVAQEALQAKLAEAPWGFWLTVPQNMAAEVQNPLGNIKSQL
jgi:hypothetical protein